MERFTTRNGSGIPELKGISKSLHLCPKDRVLILDAIDRLAAYEDKGVEPKDVLSALEMAKVVCKLEVADAYIATGLTPEEIERVLDAYGRGLTLRGDVGERVEIVKDIPTDRLRDLAKAEQDGRLVVLPCKVGDKVYRVVRYCGSSVLLDCPEGKACESCPKARFTVCSCNIETLLDAFIALENWGKDTFATRQEAEAALERNGTKLKG